MLRVPAGRSGSVRAVAEPFTSEELMELQERAMDLSHEQESDAGLRSALQLLAEAAGNLANKIPEE